MTPRTPRRKGLGIEDRRSRIEDRRLRIERRHSSQSSVLDNGLLVTTILELRSDYEYNNYDLERIIALRFESTGADLQFSATRKETGRE
jgi:hypothetical protein